MKKYEGKKSNVIGNLIKKYREEKGLEKIEVSRLLQLHAVYLDSTELKRIEDEIREKYNPDNLFKKKENIQEENKEELQLVEVKESIFKKIINKIKEIFVR